MNNYLLKFTYGNTYKILSRRQLTMKLRCELYIYKGHFVGICPLQAISDNTSGDVPLHDHIHRVMLQALKPMVNFFNDGQRD